MKRQELAAGWKLLWHGREIETQIPCSLYGDLTRCGEIADPYYRDNETEAFALSREDCTYALTFRQTTSCSPAHACCFALK